ncbi:histidine phosphatase family protein [Lysinibacillus sp. 54212]|uniref:histidine phosphatase family protein n=1 Tax=Lysinibacillus sp. 54212 TaxID=3119829 RepID=UPI002FCA588D
MVHAITIHLIRHEKTQANIERKYIGWTDEEIIPRAGHFTLPLNPAVVYGSDLIRCKQTANLYFPKATFLSAVGLRELNFGDFEMKTYEQLKDHKLYRRWIDDPLCVTPQNGESFQVFKERVYDAFWRIVTKPGEYVFVVHGGVIRLLIALFLESDFAKITANHHTVYTCAWDYFSQLKEGQRCKSISEVPITVKDNL